MARPVVKGFRFRQLLFRLPGVKKYGLARTKLALLLGLGIWVFQKLLGPHSQPGFRVLGTVSLELMGGGDLSAGKLPRIAAAFAVEAASL